MAAKGESEEHFSELSKTLKEGERLLAPTRRPDGSLRKAIRIRAGYTPQEEVAIYQPKGALLRKGLEANEVPPGYDPVLDAKPKSKSAKRNEKRKEKKQQLLVEEDGLELKTTGKVPIVEDAAQRSETVEAVRNQLNVLSVSEDHPVIVPSPEPTESSTAVPGPDLSKRIRALKKKIRLAEAQLQKPQNGDMTPEQTEKMTKYESWLQELKLLEEKKAESAAL